MTAIELIKNTVIRAQKEQELDQLTSRLEELRLEDDRDHQAIQAVETAIEAKRLEISEGAAHEVIVAPV